MHSPSLNAEALYCDLLVAIQTLMSLYAQPPRLVGVASGGAWLVERLQLDLKLPAAAGTLSSSMHRDDFSRRGLAQSSQTLLPFDVNGAHLVVVDDVLHTGRTLRAVMNELFDYGRPASIKLAVLVDRDGRELPVQADLAMACVTLPASQGLALARGAAGQFTFEVRNKPVKSI